MVIIKHMNYSWVTDGRVYNLRLQFALVYAVNVRYMENQWQERLVVTLFSKGKFDKQAEDTVGWQS